MVDYSYQMECKVTKNMSRNKGLVRLEGQEIPKSDYFWYRGQIVHYDRDIN